MGWDATPYPKLGMVSATLKRERERNRSLGLKNKCENIKKWVYCTYGLIRILPNCIQTPKSKIGGQ